MTRDELIDRLKAGSRADRELDAEIWCALRHDSKPDRWGSANGKCNGWVVMGENAVQHRTPDYTASVDACIKLIKERLPGSVRHAVVTDELAEVSLGALSSEPGAPTYRATHFEEPYATLIAFLCAVEEMNAGTGVAE